MNAPVLVVVLALAALAAARPQSQFQQQPQQFQQQPQQFQQARQVEQFQRPTPVPIISRQETRDDHGQFALAIVSADGIARTDSGALVKIKDGENKDDYYLRREGSYKYTSPEGTPVEVHYIADENGFQIVNPQ
ncbi:larval cuticle protein 1-like [Frankliniella occidentalis]|uniref:Larval cuticle protein 1-like n=1 Tax=Frankliniella occidentalis TaxID=133901 RepID=A0A9C6XDK9_FRAOC|nr:larval cuticle protein 1-like [Frankliniella occidentalis]